MTLRWTGRARRAAIRVVRRLPPPLRRPLIRVARRVEQGRVLPRAADLAPQDGPWVAEPEISVVVTSRNRSELLPIALRSIQKQDLDAFECIIVDDDSTDDAVLVAQSFAAVDPRFRIIVHDATLGPAAARNSALAAARASLVCFLDDDDFLLAGSLRSRRDALQDQPADVAGVFCDWINTDEHVGLEAFHPRRHARRRPGVSLGSLGDGTPFILSSPLLRTDVVRSVGGFDERLTRAEDADLWFRIARLGFRLVDAGCLGVAYRRTPGSLVTAAPGAQLDALLDLFERAERPDWSVDGHGPLPAPEPVSAVALSHARRGHILRYVALTAIDDFDRAVAAGERGLHPIVRRSIDVEFELPALRNHVAARLALDDMRMPTVDDALRRVLNRLRPPIAERWQPLVEPGPWRDALLARARAIRPRPLVTSARVRTAVAGAVVLVPEARYHVDELGPLADELRARGIPVQFMVSPKAVPAALDELGRYADDVLPFAPDEIAHARALVTLNDWGPVKQLVQIANDAGVATFGKVEGVQDFDDIESTWERNPYRTVSYVLAQGANDVAALPEKDTFVVGSSRLERVWAAEPSIPGEHALINLNFTFHVLAGHRDSWLSSVRDALGLAGVPMLVSTHPAERGAVLGAPIAAKPFRFEVTKAGIVVSRFSTVPFEAMARGVPFVYHNPHGERFPTFLDPGGAFLVCSSADELVEAAREALSWRGGYRQRCAEFFARQISIDPNRTSAARAADVIARLTRPFRGLGT